MSTKMNKICILSTRRLQSTTAHHQHVPSIKFIGKRSKETSHSITTQQKSAAPVPISPSKPVKKSSPNVKDFTALKDKAFFGRPKFSQAEIDSIMSGGAM